MRCERVPGAGTQSEEWCACLRSFVYFSFAAVGRAVFSLQISLCMGVTTAV